MARRSPLPSDADKAISLRAPVARNSKGAADRNAACGENFLCRRSLQSRSALYACATARLDDDARAARDLMPVGWRDWRAGLGARIRRSRPQWNAQWPNWRRSPPRLQFFSRRGGFRALPAEIALRLLGRAVDEVGDEGPVELGKLEALKSALDAGQNGFRRTLAGAVVTLKGHQIIVERAPPRGRKPLTKRRPHRARRAKTR